VAGFPYSSRILPGRDLAPPNPDDASLPCVLSIRFFVCLPPFLGSLVLPDFFSLLCRKTPHVPPPLLHFLMLSASRLVRYFFFIPRAIAGKGVVPLTSRRANACNAPSRFAAALLRLSPFRILETPFRFSSIAIDSYLRAPPPSAGSPFPP